MTRASWRAFGIAVFTEFSLGYFILLEEVISFNPLMHHFIRFWVSVRNSFPVRRKLTPSVLPHSWDTSETQSSSGSFVTPSHHFYSWEDRPFGLDLIFIMHIITYQFNCKALNFPTINNGLPWRLSGKESACQCSRHGFNPWVRKMPWRRKWQPTPVFWKFHGQKSLKSYSARGWKELDMTDHTPTHTPSVRVYG